MELGVSGLATGFDWRALVEQISDVERTPQRGLLTEQNKLQQRNSAYTGIKTQLAVLQSRVDALKEPSFFEARLAAAGDATIASASAGAGAAQGSHAFNFVQLATTAQRLGSANVGAPLSATDDVSALTLSSAGFARAVTAGTFTVNGQQITIATSDTLQSVFARISTATSGAVAATYSAATDKISLSSGSEIVLGSATDTSNFLTLAKLHNHGDGSITSTGALGGIRSAGTLAGANFATAVSDGGSGAGAFKINGVSIAFSATGDSVKNVLDRINDSTAGVNASYDTVNDRFTLTNKATGDVGVALEDVTGNFLAATGLSGGTVARGKDLIYTIDGGGQLTSQSNTITEASSGLAGLSVTALKVGATTVDVSSDTSKFKTAITSFLSDYNKMQSLIDAQTASTTDTKGKVTAGVLAAENDVSDLASRLRATANASVSGLTGTLKSLNDLGIVSNGDDNSLKLEDEGRLAAALTDNLSSVKAIFADGTNGLAVKLGAYLERTVGDDGTLPARQTNLTKQAAAIDTQVRDMERVVQANRQRLLDSFVAMETAQANISNQLKYLQKTFQ